MRALRDGEPDKFITLTLRAGVGGSLRERQSLMRAALKLLARRIRRQFPGKRLEYAWTQELTVNGEPHLHILARAPFIPQRWLSQQWAELVGSPIVDIRAVHGADQAVHYVTKYLGKAPASAARTPRFHFSRGYLPKQAEGEVWNWKAEGFSLERGINVTTLMHRYGLWLAPVTETRSGVMRYDHIRSVGHAPRGPPHLPLRQSAESALPCPF